MRIISFNIRKAVGRKLGFLLNLFLPPVSADVIFLQESGPFNGSAASIQSALRIAGVHVFASPAHHQAGGVCCLLRKSLVPIVSSFSETAPGRALSLVFSFPSVSLSISNLYLFSFHDAEASNAELADKSLWITSGSLPPPSQGPAIILGDLNASLVRNAESPCLRLLEDSGFLDCFTFLHPGPAAEVAGWTCASSAGPPSRIDFCFARGISPVECDALSDSPPGLSDHRPLFILFPDPSPLPPAPPPLRPSPLRSLPRVHPSSESRLLRLSKSVASLLALSPVEPSLAQSSIELVFNRACAVLGTHGPKARSRKDRAISLLKRLLSMPRYTGSHISSLPYPFRRALELSEVVPPFSSSRASPLLVSVALERLSSSRLAPGLPAGQLPFGPGPPPPLAPPLPPLSAARAHRLLNPQSAIPFDSLSLPSGVVLHSSEQIGSTLSSHFQALFGSVSPLSSEPPPHLRRSEDPLYASSMSRLPAHLVDSSIYSGLLSPFSEDEMRRIIMSSKNRVAPGPDGVSGGLWKALVQRDSSDAILKFLTSLCNSILSSRRIPPSLNKSLLTLIRKNPSLGWSLKNLRPVALQDALPKFLLAGLAARLSKILDEFGVLSEAQEAFKLGGCSLRAVHRTLDVMEMSSVLNSPAFLLKIDIRRAFDEVPHHVVLDALLRIGLPSESAQFLVSFLSSSSFSILSPHGSSDFFPILRGVRQGCPLSPLLFIIVFDILHASLRDLKMADGRPAGITFPHLPNAAPFASSGFADDLFIFGHSQPSCQVAADRVTGILDCWWMAPNPAKSELIICPAPADPVSVLVAGSSVLSSLPSTSHRLLGITVRGDLDWSSAHSSISSTIGHYVHVADEARLSVGERVVFFNTYLQPKLVHRFRATPAPRSVLRRWDLSLANSFSRLAGSFVSISPPILSSLLGLALPSTIYARVASLEVAVRLNDPRADLARLCWSLTPSPPFRSRRQILSSSLISFGIYCQPQRFNPCLSYAPNQVPTHLSLSLMDFRNVPPAQSNISVSIAPRSTPVENVVHPVDMRPQIRGAYLDGSFDRVKGKGGCAAVLLSPAVHDALSSASIESPLAHGAAVKLIANNPRSVLSAPISPCSSSTHAELVAFALLHAPSSPAVCLCLGLD